MAEFYGNYITGRTESARNIPASQAHLGGFFQAFRDILTFDGAQNDTIFMGLLPDDAVLSDALSKVQWTGLGANVTLSIGVEDNTTQKFRSLTVDGAGLVGKTGILLDAEAVSNGGNASMVKDVALTDRFKPLWELAGLTASSGQDLKVIATVGGGNPSSGTIAWEQGFIRA